jgi:hypothetical protein
MSAIAGSFISPFPTTGSLGLSLTSIQGGSGTAANATAILSSEASDTSSPLSILGSTSATTSNSPTINALTTGELSNQDHKIIAQIGETANDSLSVPWNANGTEPTELTNLRQLGWIKVASLETTAGNPKPTGANYSLTPVGQAIFKRTVATTLGPGTEAALSNAQSASTANAAAVDSNLSSEVSTLVGALSSVGVNIQI